jgi:hypothetical protein
VPQAGYSVKRRNLSKNQVAVWRAKKYAVCAKIEQKPSLTLFIIPGGDPECQIATIRRVKK